MRKAAAEAGWLRALLWRLDFYLVSSLLWLFRLLSIDQASRLGDRFGRWIGPHVEKHRHLVDNLKIAFPDANSSAIDKLSRDIWGNGGAVLAEFAHMDRLIGEMFDNHVKIRGAEELRDLLDDPVVIVTAHYGNWELIGVTAAKLGLDLTCLYSPPANPLLNRRLMRERLAMGIELLSRDASTRDLFRTLQRGRSLGVVMDRRVDNGERLAFFGHDKPTTLIPARLALKCDRPLVPVQARRLSNAQFLVTIHPPVRPRNSRASELERAIDMTNQVNALFEVWIREAPQNWFCTKRLWDKELGSRASVNARLSSEIPLRRAS